MDEIHFAPPKRPWNDNSPVHTNKQWFPIVSRWCEMDFVHPQLDRPEAQKRIRKAMCGHPNARQVAVLVATDDFHRCLRRENDSRMRNLDRCPLAVEGTLVRVV